MLNQGVGSWPARRARIAPHRVALIHDDNSWTYAQCHDRVTRLAHALRRLGVGHGDLVAYLGPNHPAFAETLFAVGSLGAVFVPLNTRLAAPELSYIVADSGATVLIHDADLPGADLGVAYRIEVGPQYEALICDAAAEPIDEPVGLDELCMIMYTSGTTGRPKGAMISHGNITWNAYNVLVDVDVAADEVTLVSAPLFHTAALNMTFLPTFLKGGASVLVSAFDPDRAIDLIARHGVTWMFGVPAIFNAICQSPLWPTADLSSVRNLMCGGAPVPESLIRTYQERGLTFIQGYGMTEASPGALLLRAADSARKVGSAGTSMFFTDVRVVRPDLTDVEKGEKGEVVVRGPNVMAGYRGLPEESERAFAPGGWFRSGDAAVVDDEGYVFVVDRIKDMIISGGENIYPAEVEEIIYQHPAVAECALIGVPDQKWGEVGRAVVVLRAGASATAEEILGFLDGKLARYKIPKSVVFADALPRTATGKVLKLRLRELHGKPEENP
jgi:fatty-acyl-CoA synthase